MKTEDRQELLTEFINEQGEWADNYVSHEDNINAYADCFEVNNIHYCEIDEEDQERVQTIIEEMDPSDILKYCAEPDIHYGYHSRADEIWSISFGEIETQITGIGDAENTTDCIYTSLCEGLTKEEIEEASSRSEYYCRDGYIYSDHSYDRVSIVLDVGLLLAERQPKFKLRLVV